MTINSLKIFCNYGHFKWGGKKIPIHDELEEIFTHKSFTIFASLKTQKFALKICKDRKLKGIKRFFDVFLSL